tara:strand:- start:1025 stop:1702 length:678 start_codon:yes stop_codon:yes gene_type:complete
MKIILVLSLAFVHLISNAITVGYKYWDAPFNDEDFFGEYSKSSISGLTISKNISDSYYVSGNFFLGTYEQDYIDQSFSETFERDITNVEIIIAKSGDIFDYGIGFRSVDWASGGSYSYVIDGQTYTGSYGGTIELMALLGYVGYSKSFNDNLGFYAGFSYAFDISSEADNYDNKFHHTNTEAGIYYSGIINENINATLGYRRLEFTSHPYEFYAQGVAFSATYTF